MINGNKPSDGNVNIINDNATAASSQTWSINKIKEVLSSGGGGSTIQFVVWGEND